jgi:hypothetical protein
MMRIEFLIEGSRGDEYTVTFMITDNSARAACSCAAGAANQFCKHRAALLDGDITRLRSPNATDVTRLGSLLRDTDLWAAYGQLLMATKAHDEAKKALDGAKKRLARVAHQ